MMLCYANTVSPPPKNTDRVRALQKTVCSMIKDKTGEQVKVFVDGQESGVLSVHETEQSRQIQGVDVVEYHFESMERQYIDEWPIPDNTRLKPWMFFKIADQIYTNTFWVEAYGFRLDFAWVGKNNTNFFTGNFAPVPEFVEDYGNFMEWVERLKDNAYVVEQFYMQEMMNDTYNNHPAAIAAMEERIAQLSEIASWFKWDRVRAYDEPIALLDHAVRPKTKHEIEDEKANSRAKALMNSWLSPEELEGWEKENAIILNSKLGEDIIYIFKRDRRIEIQSKSQKKALAQLCVYPGGEETLCSNDVVLGNVLACKADEETFIGRANIIKTAGEVAVPEVLMTINKKYKASERQDDYDDIDGSVMARSAA